jgi:hypothetical protein
MVALTMIGLDERGERPSQVVFREPLRRGAGGVGIEPPRRIAQVAAAHDVVPFEHRAGFVPCELHRHALGHAGPHEVANNGPTEVVRDASGTARGQPRLSRADSQQAARVRMADIFEWAALRRKSRDWRK